MTWKLWFSKSETSTARRVSFLGRKLSEPSLMLELTYRSTNKEGVFAGVRRIYESLPPAEQAALLERLTAPQ